MWEGDGERDNSCAVLGCWNHSQLCKVWCGIKESGNHQGIIRESWNPGLVWVGRTPKPIQCHPSPIPGWSLRFPASPAHSMGCPLLIPFPEGAPTIPPCSGSCFQLGRGISAAPSAGLGFGVGMVWKTHPWSEFIQSQGLFFPLFLGLWLCQ